MTASTRIQVLAIAAAALLPLASPLAAQAVSINVGGTDYEVFYISTSYNDKPDLFGAASPGQMPWWGSADLAYEFGLAMYDQLGEDVYQAGYGPVFAYAYNSAGFDEVYGRAQNTLDIDEQLDLPLAASAIHPYAYARANTPVPAPMPLFGAAAAFGWARRLRNNQKLINRKVCRMNQAAD